METNPGSLRISKLETPQPALTAASAAQRTTENGVSDEVLMRMRRATITDLDAMAEIAAQNFSGHGGRAETARRWLERWHFAFPIYHIFVGFVDEKMVGYITWRFEGGFGRQHLVVELDQTALHKEAPKGRGIGEQLIYKSLYGRDGIRHWVKENMPQATLIRTFVWFYAKNTIAYGSYSKFFPKFGGSREQYSEPELMLKGEIMLLDTESPIGT